MATAAAVFKKGERVRYQARVSKGRGTIAAVKKTGRGIWYRVKPDDGSAELFVRVSGLKEA